MSQTSDIKYFLEVLDRDVKVPHENLSICVLLCRDKTNKVVEYALLSRSLSPIILKLKKG
jgi:hypothetical protein